MVGWLVGEFVGVCGSLCEFVGRVRVSGYESAGECGVSECGSVGVWECGRVASADGGSGH